MPFCRPTCSVTISSSPDLRWTCETCTAGSTSRKRRCGDGLARAACVSGALTLHYNKAVFILEPTPVSDPLARKRVEGCERPDGCIEAAMRGVPSPIPRSTNAQGEPGGDCRKQAPRCRFAGRQIHAGVAPHHSKRNNSDPARSSQSFGVFAKPAQPYKPKSARRGRPPLPRDPRFSTKS